MCYKLTSHNARYRLLHYPDYYMYSIDLQRIILYSNNPYLQYLYKMRHPHHSPGFMI